MNTSTTNISTDTTTTIGNWYYEDDGKRVGPVPESQIVALLKDQTLDKDSLVWVQGAKDWQKIEATALAVHLDTSAPPPLDSASVNNTIVWTLAFAPLIGLFLEYCFAYAVNKTEFHAAAAMEQSKYWYITLFLNIALSLWDEHKLKAAGYSSAKLRGFVWLVPVYLYQRATLLKHNLAYFIVWIACFCVSLFG